MKAGEENLPKRPPPGLKILDCLAASGLRSMRYFKEIKNVDLVAVNDLDSAAIELAENNIQVNGVDPSVVRTRVGDGTMLCYEGKSGVENIRPGESALCRYELACSTNTSICGISATNSVFVSDVNYAHPPIWRA